MTQIDTAGLLMTADEIKKGELNLINILSSLEGSITRLKEMKGLEAPTQKLKEAGLKISEIRMSVERTGNAIEEVALIFEAGEDRIINRAEGAKRTYRRVGVGTSERAFGDNIRTVGFRV